MNVLTVTTRGCVVSVVLKTRQRSAPVSTSTPISSLLVASLLRIAATPPVTAICRSEDTRIGSSHRSSPPDEMARKAPVAPALEVATSTRSPASTGEVTTLS